MPVPPTDPGQENPKVGVWFDKAAKWSEEFRALRAIVLSAGLEERLRWRQSVYAHQGSNVAILSVRKDGAMLGLFRGALMDDPGGVLRAPGPNSRSVREMRFSSPGDVVVQKATVRRFLDAAKSLQESGTRVDPAEIAPDAVPAELDAALAVDGVLEFALTALTSGRRRSYLLHFNAGMKAETREARITRCRAKILSGKGFNER